MGKYKNVGGQAVIEGVMMRGSKKMSTAIRKENGEISVKSEEIVPLSKKNKLFSIPIIRGVVSFIDSLIVGVNILNYSASFFEEDDEEEGKFDKWFKEIFKEKSTDILVAISLILSLIFSFILFFATPTFISGLLKNVVKNKFVLNILEGLLRVLILVVYIFVVSKMSDIKRVFQYHGAEHKTIFCYESEEELTVENVKKFGRFHPRCGTNFLFLVMIISILIFTVVGWESLWERIVYRLILLPVVLGISYEVIKWMGKSDGFFSKFFAYPGLLLQRITTEEPDEKQIEVAIKALKIAEGLEEVNALKENINQSDKDEVINSMEDSDEISNKEEK